jgi:transposase InsO family protein
LSRYCDVSAEVNETDDLEVLDVLDMADRIHEELLLETPKDEEWQELSSLIQHGWPDEIDQVSKKMKKFWNFREELTIYENLLFKSDRVVIPRAKVNYAIRMAHIEHQRIQHHALQRARQSMFWYNMSNDITNHVQQGSICQHGQPNNVKEPIMIKPVPQYPFEVVASDLFYFSGSQYILMVNSFSGYYYFVKMDETTSHSAIAILKRCVSVHGVPKEFNSDNSPQYSSAQFRAFSKTWNFKHITSSLNYPRLNELVERSVQSAKKMLKKCKKTIPMLIWHY